MTAPVIWLVLAWTAAGAAAGELSLEKRRVPPGTLFSATADGRLALLDPDSLELEVWSTRGRRLHVVQVAAPSPGARPSGVALNGDRVLVAFIRDDQPAHTCVLHALDGSGRELTFVGGEVPSRLAATPGGWLFERLAPGDVPLIELFGIRGEPLGQLAPPEDAVARAREAFSDPSYAFLRLLSIGGEIWATPSFSYELWRLADPGSWERVPVPACLSVSASYVHGEAARRRMLERAERLPEAEQRRLLDKVAWTRTMGLDVHSYATAVRTVVAHGDRLVALTEPYPEREQGGCRLDVWDLRGRVPLATQPVAGRCPGLVALGEDGAWILTDERLALVELPGPNGPCPRNDP